MERKSYNIVFMIFCLVLLILAGCASMPEEVKTPAGSYYMARSVLNSYWETYLDYRDSLPEGERKQKLREKFDDIGVDSVFTQTKRVLDDWEKVIDTPEGFRKEKLFDTLLNRIIQKMLTEDLITIDVD